MVMMNVHERQIKILEENLRAFPSPQSFDNTGWWLFARTSRRMDIRGSQPNDYQPLSLSLLFCTTTLHPRVIHSYEVISDSNIKPENWPRAVQRLESVAEILAGIHPWSKDNTDNTRGRIDMWGEGKKWRRKIGGISLLPVSRSTSYYRIIIALQRVISGEDRDIGKNVGSGR